MRVLHAIGLFVAAVVAVIVGIFGSLMILNKLTERNITRSQPEPGVVKVWPLSANEEGQKVLPILVEYEHEGEPFLMLMLIINGKNEGSEGIEVDNLNEANTLMNALLA